MSGGLAVRAALVVLVVAAAAVADAASGGWGTVNRALLVGLLAVGLLAVAVTGRRRS